MKNFTFSKEERKKISYRSIFGDFQSASVGKALEVFKRNMYEWEQC